MRKILAIALSVMLVLQIPVAVYSLEDREVIGLQEHMDALWMKNLFSQEQMDDIVRAWEEYHTYFYMVGDDYVNYVLARRQGRTVEEQLAYELNAYRPDMETAVLITCQNTRYRYTEEYARNGVFEYILSDVKYWRALSAEGVKSVFTFDGTPKLFGEIVIQSEDGVGISEEGFELLKDTDRVEQMLLEKGETEVLRVSIVGGRWGFLYIKCPQNEYLISLSAYAGSEHFESVEIKPAAEMLQDLAEMEKGVFASYSGTITAKKPAFTAEAEVLQADGLLYGNEKGLDLLKPLTRIEAATLLVRALGLENEPTQAQSEFTDIPDSHWGVKYANIAAEHGITQGVGNGNFAPNTLVTDNQFATFILRAADEPEFDWEKAIDMLIEKGIITAEEAQSMDFFTRGDMAKIIYEAREKGLL